MSSISTPLTSQYEARRVAARFDWPLIASALLLLMFGLMSIYSVGQVNPEVAKDFKKQIISICIGIIPFGILASVSPKFWQRSSNWLYVLNIVVLLAVFVVGSHVKGAERWIKLPGGLAFQPSELAKLLCILTLSSYYSLRQDSVHKLSTFLLGFLHVLPAIILIRFQPHLGSATVVFVLFLAISVIAGVPGRHLAGLVGVLLVLAGIGWSVPSIRAKMVPAYQMKRWDGLERKTKDKQNGNYQTNQAEIAFGVGGVYGSGYLHGEQKSAGYIPEQHDDFILTVIGEEGGLIGCTLLLITYGFFFYRIFLVMLGAINPYYKMVTAGVFAVLGFHTFINMAMVLQMVPVVGLWLPFMSYGGTAVWLCMSCVGLLVGIRRKQRPILF